MEEFLEAIRKNNLEKVKELIHNGADPTSHNNFAIHWASRNGHLEAVKLLLEHGADPTADNNYAIQWASRNGHFRVVSLLLEHRADPTADNNFAIQWASRNNHLKVINLLIQNNADIHANNNMPIKQANEDNNQELINLLLKHDSLESFLSTHPLPNLKSPTKFPFYYSTKSTQYLLSDNPPAFFKHLQEDLYYHGENPSLQEFKQAYFARFPKQKSAIY